MLMKNPSDTIGNRIRNLPACSAVPLPTAPPWVRNSTIHYSKKPTPAQYTIPNVTLWLNVIYTIFSIHPCTALQPLLGPGLAQKSAYFLLYPQLVSTFVFRGSAMHPSGRDSPFLFLVFPSDLMLMPYCSCSECLSTQTTQLTRRSIYKHRHCLMTDCWLFDHWNTI